MKNKIRVAIICGGSSPEREVSINSGNHIYDAINKNKYDIDMYDPVKDLYKFIEDANKIDFAFVSLHGSCGEDGSMHGLLKLLGIPHQGSGIMSNALAMNKEASKYLFKQAKIPVNSHVVINKKDFLNGHYTDIINNSKLELPLIVKPVEAGSSFGISIVEHMDKINVSITEALKYGNAVLVESHVKGIELTCGILGNNRLKVLPLVEIVCKNEFFNYYSKYYQDSIEEICPARINDTLTKKAQLYAKKAHKALFCKGYSRTDMILRGQDFYILETNTIPGMTPKSLYPKAARCAGISFESLIEKLIKLGFENA